MRNMTLATFEVILLILICFDKQGVKTKLSNIHKFLIHITMC